MKQNQKIYLDYQASTPLDTKVLEKMLPYFTEEFGNPHSSGHAFGWNAANAVESARVQVAKMIGADADEVVFTSGATESNNLALLGLARKNDRKERNRIFVGATEHKCVLAAARAIQEQLDYEVLAIPVDHEGQVDLEWLKEHISERTLLVSVMAVNNEIGTIAPIELISQICRLKGALFHTDAAQAPYAMEIDRLTESSDLISLSGHKMYGPKGIGALYIRRDMQNHFEPIIYGGGQQNNLRSGTVPVPLAVGLGEASRVQVEEWDSIQQEELANLRNYLWSLIREIYPAAVLNGPSLADRHPGNLNVQFPRWDAHDLLMRLQPHVAVSTGAACASGVEEASHVLHNIGLNTAMAASSVRFSLGRLTKKSDIKNACKYLSLILQDGLIK